MGEGLELVPWEGRVACNFQGKKYISRTTTTKEDKITKKRFNEPLDTSNTTGYLPNGLNSKALSHGATCAQHWSHGATCAQHWPGL